MSVDGYFTYQHKEKVMFNAMRFRWDRMMCAMRYRLWQLKCVIAEKLWGYVFEGIAVEAITDCSGNILWIGCACVFGRRYVRIEGNTLGDACEFKRSDLYSVPLTRMTVRFVVRGGTEMISCHEADRLREAVSGCARMPY